MAHFNFVISQNAKLGHGGFYIDRHQMTSLLTCDMWRYCTEASNQKSKYAYRKIFFYKKCTGSRPQYYNEDSYVKQNESVVGRDNSPIMLRGHPQTLSEYPLKLQG